MTINGLVSGVFDILPLLKTALDVRDQRMVDEHLNTIRQRLTEVLISAGAQAEKNMELVERLQAAKEELAQLKEALGRRDAVRLVSVGDTGVMAYQPLELRQGEAPHYLCQACHDAGVRTVLQPWNRMLSCPTEPRHNITIRRLDVNPVASRYNW